MRPNLLTHVLPAHPLHIPLQILQQRHPNRPIRRRKHPHDRLNHNFLILLFLVRERGREGENEREELSGGGSATEFESVDEGGEDFIFEETGWEGFLFPSSSCPSSSRSSSIRRRRPRNRIQRPYESLFLIIARQREPLQRRREFHEPIGGPPTLTRVLSQVEERGSFQACGGVGTAETFPGDVEGGWEVPALWGEGGGGGVWGGEERRGKGTVEEGVEEEMEEVGIEGGGVVSTHGRRRLEEEKEGRREKDALFQSRPAASSNFGRSVGFRVGKETAVVLCKA